MLRGIPNIISPDLLCALAKLGHGDEVVIADGNFPADTMAEKGTVIYAAGHGVPEILRAILSLLPLDTYTEKPVALMKLVEGDTCKTPEIWGTYERILAEFEPEHHEIEFMDRFDFYERAKKASLIIATSETAIYANILIKKGVVL
ncbi:MAG: fucose isomerase [Oscillospiraceae bacterium]|nr:fucose isomerase [Oscillospiraceae bacterium]